ncbi:MAG TPA: serine hydrolase [Rhodothermales bacterium]|mgnify:CR=1 FL=1|nr:serine hydrolase [Rhodothermales bacterium]
MMKTGNSSLQTRYTDNRWSYDKTRKYTIGFVVFMLLFSMGTTLFIYLGKKSPAMQSRLQALSQEMLPSVRSQEWAARQGYGEVAQKLTAFIQHEMADKKIPGLTISLADGKDIVWARGFGRTDTTQRLLATPESVWRVASVTKLFTAVAIMQLVEKGVLALDTPISTYLPDIRFNNPFEKPITLRHLLSHRSGILREPAVGSYFDPTTPSLATTLKSLSGTDVYFEPGTNLKYSNAAFTLLGYLIEKTSGMPYKTYIRNHILLPTDMPLSAIDLEPRLKPKMAVGYMWRYDGQLFRAPIFDMGIAPAAGLNTTMPDLARFAMMLYRGGVSPTGKQVIQASTLETMWTPQFTDGKNGFGLGFYVSDFNGLKRIQHSGVQYGIATRFSAIPSEKLAVMVSGNLDNSNTVIDRINLYATNLLLALKQKKPLPEPELTVAIPEAEARPTLGYYQNEKTQQIHVVRWFNKALWFHDGTYYQRIRKPKNGGGMITDGRLGYGTAVQFDANALTFDGQRYLKVPKPSIQVPLRWKEYIGEYGWDHNVLFVFPQNNRLMARIEWFDDYPLQEEGYDQFSFPNSGLYQSEKVVFTRDKSGKINGIKAAGIFFKRRKLSIQPHLTDGIRFAEKDQSVAYILPQKTQEELLLLAKEGAPRTETGKRPMDLVQPALLDRTILLDMRYATDRNFMGMRFYDLARAYLQRPAAMALLRVNQKLKKQGLGLMIHDAYRPWYVTKMFWEATPIAQRNFVANPADGSRHNRGCAVDLTLYHLASGVAVEMPSLYDEFSERAAANYAGGTEEQRRYRQILRQTMVSEGFTIMEDEWWHFDYHDWRNYPIGTKRFEEL